MPQPVVSEPLPARSSPAAAFVPSRAELSAVVLCGGQSRRMGSDKASANIGGRSFLEHAVGTLSELCGRVALACGTRERYGEYGLPLLLDEVEGLGPLGALRVALVGMRAEWLLVLACDLPGVRAAMFESLLERAAREQLDVCLFERDGFPEPLCGVYRQSCLPAIEAALAAGERRATSFWSRPGAGQRALRIGLVPADSHQGSALANLNTPEALERAQRGWTSPGASSNTRSGHGAQPHDPDAGASEVRA